MSSYLLYHDLGYFLVVKQLFDRPQTNGFIQHVLGQARAIDIRRQLVAELEDNLPDQPFDVLAQLVLVHRADIGAPQIHRRQQFVVDAVAPLEFILVLEVEDSFREHLGILDSGMARHPNDGLEHVVVIDREIDLAVGLGLLLG